MAANSLPTVGRGSQHKLGQLHPSMLPFPVCARLPAAWFVKAETECDRNFFVAREVSLLEGAGVLLLLREEGLYRAKNNQMLFLESV